MHYMRAVVGAATHMHTQQLICTEKTWKHLRKYRPLPASEQTGTGQSKWKYWRKEYEEAKRAADSL